MREVVMTKTVAIGIQNFEKLIRENYFYIDKTMFIKEWWERGDNTTLITRPRRFGKTLNMSMVERFFSMDYADKGDVFEGLYIWEDEKYRRLQGTYPVISLSFARIKDSNYKSTIDKICEIIQNLYSKYSYVRECEALNISDKAFFDRIVTSCYSESDMTSSLYQLSRFLNLYHKKNVIILLDEYDTPMHESYVNGYWDELVSFTRSLFNSTFKTNPYLERALMTGIIRVSKESIFSDLNHLKVITTTSNEYATSFGFTEREVFDAVDMFGYTEKKGDVKNWYDGFVFGKHKDIYNPWSILNFLDTGEITTYWANTSANGLVTKLLREGNRNLKEQFERLMAGDVLHTTIDEQIVYNQLNGSEKAIWSLLLASGYLKVLSVGQRADMYDVREPKYELALTNMEVRVMFNNMVRSWFRDSGADYNDFIKALLLDDIDAMNEYMYRVVRDIFSYFDAGKRTSDEEPERFYHGFVLGLLVELQGEYIITSNRESGFGRYDVMIEPKDKSKDAIILEFKVLNHRRENSLEETVTAALKQIEDKQYAALLETRGIAKDHIRKYGIAFQGKKVLIG